MQEKRGARVSTTHSHVPTWPTAPAHPRPPCLGLSAKRQHAVSCGPQRRRAKALAVLAECPVWHAAALVHLLPRHAGEVKAVQVVQQRAPNAVAAKHPQRVVVREAAVPPPACVCVVCVHALSIRGRWRWPAERRALLSTTHLAAGSAPDVCSGRHETPAPSADRSRLTSVCDGAPDSLLAPPNSSRVGGEPALRESHSATEALARCGVVPPQSADIAHCCISCRGAGFVGTGRSSCCVCAVSM
jgi:hypothetical protein